jgi:queuine/archaeosine tRNA-ribosyltransferase
LEETSEREKEKEEEEKGGIKLLLHCPQGTIPYLTPDLIRRCCSPAATNDVLMLGVAVRDTCLIPVYKPSKKKDQPAKTVAYTWGGSIHLDPWLRQYAVVTVPTFDQQEDAVAAAGHNEVGTALTVSSNHVYLWTSHGRHALTPDQHVAACASLNGDVQVPLFESLPPPVLHNNPDSVEAVLYRKKRHNVKEHAVTRHQTWLTSQLEASSSSGRNLWAPLIVADDTDFDNDRQDKQQLSWIVQQCKAHDTLRGIVVTGWHRVTDKQRRTEILEKVIHAVADDMKTNVAVLCSTQLSHLLQAVKAGCHVVGTDLPQKWAKAKKAFACDVSGWKSGTDTPDGNARSRPVDEDGCVALHVADPQDAVKGHAWYRDTRPIVDDCTCLTCQQHTRAYLYHLVCAQELLAEQLLFLHNLHHLLRLVRECSEAAEAGTTGELCDHLQSQLGSTADPK